MAKKDNTLIIAGAVIGGLWLLNRSGPEDGGPLSGIFTGPGEAGLIDAITDAIGSAFGDIVGPAVIPDWWSNPPDWFGPPPDPEKPGPEPGPAPDPEAMEGDFFDWFQTLPKGIQALGAAAAAATGTAAVGTAAYMGIKGTQAVYPAARGFGNLIERLLNQIRQGKAGTKGGLPGQLVRPKGIPKGLWRDWIKKGGLGAGGITNKFLSPATAVWGFTEMLGRITKPAPGVEWWRPSWPWDPAPGSSGELLFPWMTPRHSSSSPDALENYNFSSSRTVFRKPAKHRRQVITRRGRGGYTAPPGVEGWSPSKPKRVGYYAPPGVEGL